MARCNCGARCSCVLEAGDNIEITGSGSSGAPYVINAATGVEQNNLRNDRFFGDGSSHNVAAGSSFTQTWTKASGSTSAGWTLTSNRILSPNGSWPDGYTGQKLFLWHFQVLYLYPQPGNTWGGGNFARVSFNGPPASPNSAVGYAIVYEQPGATGLSVETAGSALFSGLAQVVPNQSDMTPFIDAVGLDLTTAYWNFSLVELSRI